jgi:hypothetical protein
LKVNRLLFVRLQHIMTKYNISRNHESLQTHRIHKMKYLSEKMLSIMERLSEMFPGSSYQSRLDQYLSTKGITDAAQLENYIRQFNSQKESYL